MSCKWIIIKGASKKWPLNWKIGKVHLSIWITFNSFSSILPLNRDYHQWMWLRRKGRNYIVNETVSQGEVIIITSIDQQQLLQIGSPIVEYKFHWVKKYSSEYSIQEIIRITAFHSFLSTNVHHHSTTQQQEQLLPPTHTLTESLNIITIDQIN